MAVIDINGDAADRCAEEFGGSSFAADVTDPDALSGAVDAAAQAMGGITTLFNNAGIGNQSPLHEWPVEEWNRLLAVNLTGVYLGFRAAIPHIRASGGGTIVSTASISGTRPAAGEAPTRRPRRAWPPSPRRRHSSTVLTSGSTRCPQG